MSGQCAGHCQAIPRPSPDHVCTVFFQFMSRPCSSLLRRVFRAHSISWPPADHAQTVFRARA
eukprot:3541886-Lingulodinium_polyedra.AAC.1